MFLQVSPNVPMWVGVQGVVSGLVRETGGSDRAPPQSRFPRCMLLEHVPKENRFLTAICK